ncbi:MAG: hypothetical protein CK522_04680 [Opitutia bacterium]|nr:MAG: hypothetical protein CK522_04680 [Opitutae bacterium]
MSVHPYGEGQPPKYVPAPNTGGEWARSVRLLRLGKSLAKDANHIYLSRVPSILREIVVSVGTFPAEECVLTYVETWNRPTAMNVLGSDILNAFDATTTHPSRAPLLTVRSARGTVQYSKVPTWSLGVLAGKSTYDTAVEE